MPTSYNESIIDAWDYWCYFQKIKRNKNTGSELIISSDVFIPSVPGLLRVGEKISDLSTTYEIIERTVIALRPDLTRLGLQDLPFEAKLMLYFYSIGLSEGYSTLSMTVKPWANPNSSDWNLDTKITYEDLTDYYIPFDLDSFTYSPSLYEAENEIRPDEYSSLFGDIKNLFIAFMQGDAGGILILAENGYADVFGPGCPSSTIRPYVKTSQTVTGRMSSFLSVNTEVTSESKVKGVCRDREGNIITGKQCRIIIFNKDNLKILGTGLSSAQTGAFLINASCKVGELVSVNFLDSNESIAGCELMTTVSKNTI